MEKIIGSIVGVSGHTFDTQYDLFFTTERLIAVIIKHPADINRKYPSLWEMAFTGSSWTIRKERHDQERLAQERRRISQSLPPDELTATHNKNVELGYNEVASAEITSWFFQPRLTFRVTKPSVPGQRISFNLQRKQIPEAQHLLELCLPSKTREKK